MIRLPRIKFGIRSMLLMTALVAVLCWWWRQPSSGTITSAQATRIQGGMNSTNVVEMLGMPLEPRDNIYSSHRWRYRISEPLVNEEFLFLDVYIETFNDKVTHTEYRRRKASYPPPKLTSPPRQSK